MSRSPQDTIVAVSTPPGRGGIGIVRLSGPESRVIGLALLRLKQPLAHAQARVGQLLDTSTSEPHPVLDEVVATFYAGPNSYTTEDVLEVASHGSPVVLDHVLRQCVARGARLAEPGEFTQRAYLAGRLDLTQAEAVHDLIESTTLHQARLAASQLRGSLSREIAPAKAELLHLIASIEAGIDFAEDDIDLLSSEEITRRIAKIRTPLLKLEHSFAYGRLVREGRSVAIVGRPNAGKSSLFNALLGRERAIVTATPGTTRDLVMERISIAGIPVELIDTAGIRSVLFPPGTGEGWIDSPLQEAELIGIAKSQEAMAEATITLLVIDASLPLSADDISILRDHTDRPLLVALNKGDLLDPKELSLGQQELEVKPVSALEDPGVRTALELALRDQPFIMPPHIIETSSLTGAGLTELRNALGTMLLVDLPNQDTATLTNLRQHDAMTRTITELNGAKEAVKRDIPHEILILHLGNALSLLDGLTGVTTSDDLLRVIFSTFCIGK